MILSTKRLLKESIIDVEVESFENSINGRYSQILDKFMIYYSKPNNAIELTDIYIKPEFYGKGYGSKIMMELINFAYLKKLPIMLIPESERGSNKKLIDFYKKFGFVVNTGNKKDFRLSIPNSVSMYRLPR